jgi:hypothetical protein
MRAPATAPATAPELGPFFAIPRAAVLLSPPGVLPDASMPPLEPEILLVGALGSAPKVRVVAWPAELVVTSSGMVPLVVLGLSVVRTDVTTPSDLVEALVMTMVGV